MWRQPPASNLRMIMAGLLLGAVMLSVPASQQVDRWQFMRQLMVEQIQQDTRDTRSYTGLEQLSPPVIDAMLATPRHEFVPTRQQYNAYQNRALAIGHGQTISQPFIVALMTELLSPSPTDKVLEIGTGSGYQAAVLAHLCAQVISIEIVRPLAERAKNTLAELGVDNVRVIAGDGYHGYPEQAPFDGIIITAAPEQIPPALIEQLKPGGRLVAPVGAEGHTQSLQLLIKDSEGKLDVRRVLPVIFVPFTREQEAD